MWLPHIDNVFFISDVVVPEGHMQGEPLFYFVLSHSTECARMGTLNYIFHLDDMESLSFKFKDPEGKCVFLQSIGKSELIYFH